LKRFFQNDCRYASDNIYNKQEQVIEELFELFTNSAISLGLTIVVDDIYRVDEPSLALLATLCSRLQHQKLLIVLSIECNGSQERRAAIELIQQVAHPIEITALTQDNCRELFSSIFGDIPNLNVLSELAYRSCGGVLRDLMDAAQALIDEKLIRYEAGNWVLSNDSGAIEKRLEQIGAEKNLLFSVSSDAMELMSLIAIDRDYLMDVKHYTGLTEHRDSARGHRALHELVQEHVLQPIGDRYPFVRRAQEKTVIESIPKPYRQKLHLRIAEQLKTEEREPLYQTYHFLHAEELHRALDSALEFIKYFEKNPRSEIGHNPVFIETFVMLIEQADSLGFVSSHTENHRSGIVLNAGYNRLPGYVIRYLPKSIESISVYSGLTDYRRLSHLDPSERLMKALEMAQAHCEEGVSDKDFFTPVDAIQRLSQLSLIAAQYAFKMNDTPLLEIIPDLTPLSPLSPLIGVIIKLIESFRMLAYGRIWDAWDETKSAQRELEQIDSAYLDEVSRFALFGIVFDLRCSIEVTFPTPTTRTTIHQYEQLAPVLAHPFLASYYLSLGDRSLAEFTRKEFEILAVQSGQGRDLYENEILTNIPIFAISDDLLGLKRALSALEEVVKTAPLLKYLKAFVETHYLRCLGQFGHAIAVIEKSLAEMVPNQYYWAISTAVYIELLTLIGQYERAKSLGEAYLQQAKELRGLTAPIELALSLCLSKLSQDHEAHQYFETALTILQERHIEGLYLAKCYEVGARLALERVDSPAFNYYAQKWAAQYHNSSNPSLIALFDSLIREADSRHIELDPNLVGGLRTFRKSEVDVELRDKLKSTLATCEDPQQIYSDALSELLKRSQAKRGALYVETSSGLSRVSASFETSSLDAIEAEIEACYRLMAKPFGDTTTVTETEHSFTSNETNRLFLESEDDTGLTPFLLEHQSDSGAVACGLVLLALEHEYDFPDRSKSVAAVSEVLSNLENVVVTDLF
jgi:tetratricopeptide (TPR) repeat protein